jgi:hypothetical protein
MRSDCPEANLIAYSTSYFVTIERAERRRTAPICSNISHQIVAV